MAFASRSLAIMYFLKSAQHVAAGGRDPLSDCIPGTGHPIAAGGHPGCARACIAVTATADAGSRPARHAALLWVDSRSLNPALVIKPRTLLEERDIPEGLKPVILRIAHMTVDFR